MQETINYIHQISYIHSRFTNKFNKSLILTQNFEHEQQLYHQREKNGSAEQILLNDQRALNWYDYVNQRLIILRCK